MKRILLTALITCCLSTASWAGKLDIDFLKPSPTKALAYSTLVPGAGYFYLSKNSNNVENDYTQRGLLWLTLGVAATFYTASQIRDNSSGGIALGVGALLTFRLLEFGQVTTDAEIDRHQAYKEMVK